MGMFCSSPLGKLFLPSATLPAGPEHRGYPPISSSFAHTILPSGQHLCNIAYGIWVHRREGRCGIVVQYREVSKTGCMVHTSMRCF